MRTTIALVPLALLLAGCTPEGYPATDAEMWGVVVILLGAFALVGWFLWLAAR